MHPERYQCVIFRRLCAALFLLLPIAANARLAAQEPAVLSGSVVDPAQAAVPSATIQLTETRRGFVRTTESDPAGLYLFNALAPGEYSLTARKDGFAPLEIRRIVLKARDRQSLKLAMQVASLQSSVTVEAETDGVSSDPSGGAVLEQDYLRHLPVNGRGVQTLLAMAPGVVSGGGPGGNQIHANGLRSNTNYYMHPARKSP